MEYHPLGQRPKFLVFFVTGHRGNSCSAGVSTCHFPVTGQTPRACSILTCSTLTAIQNLPGGKLRQLILQQGRLNPNIPQVIYVLSLHKVTSPQNNLPGPHQLNGPQERLPLSRDPLLRPSSYCVYQMSPSKNISTSLTSQQVRAISIMICDIPYINTPLEITAHCLWTKP